MPNFAPTGQQDSHFWEGKKWRTDELGEIAVQRNSWRLATFGLILGLIIAVCGCIYLGAQPKLEPYHIRDRCDGSMEVLGAAPTTQTLTEANVRDFLRTTVETLFSVVPGDKPGMQRRLTRAFYRFTPKNGQKLFNKFIVERNPMHQFTIVNVIVTRILLQAGDTWDVRWTEEHYNEQAELKTKELYSGLFTLTARLPSGKEEIDNNPAGIFIDQFSWSRE